MPRGIGGNVCTPGGAQGGAQGADFGVSEGANYSLEFCTFLVPIPVSSHPILILIVCERVWLHAPSSHICRKFLHMSSKKFPYMYDILHSPKCANVRNFAHSHILCEFLRITMNVQNFTLP